jgi:hypothetical protein
MTPGRRREFLVWFARQDLFAPGALRATRVNRLTIALVTFFSLTTIGLSLGVWRVQVERKMHDRLNLCLFIGNPNEGQRIAPAVLEQIRSEVPKHLHEPEKFLCFPFSELRYNWFTAGTDSSFELLGRTLAAGDPLLQSRKVEEAPPLRDRGRPGVVITPAMRRQLKLPTPLPATLRLRSPVTGLEIPVPLAASWSRPISAPRTSSSRSLRPRMRPP